MLELLTVFASPSIIFMAVVAPIWLLLHYRSKRQVSQGLTEEESQELNNLVARADKLSARITNLEQILDAENPNWRAQYERQ
ncbi:MAG: envelope stress response membrane protein PspB [Ferrimonas sp.]